MNPIRTWLWWGVLAAAGAGSTEPAAPPAPAPPGGAELLDAVDANLSSHTRTLTSRMIIHGRRGSRTVESRSWGEGTEKAFTEYTAPAREAGTKMLKIGDNLWTYSPAADREQVHQAESSRP